METAKGKTNGFRHFFLYCTFQELCNYSTLDKQIYPWDRLGFQKESSIESTPWVWKIGGVGGAQAPSSHRCPTNPQKEILLHSWECKLQGSSAKTSHTALGRVSRESQHLQFLPGLVHVSHSGPLGERQSN